MASLTRTISILFAPHAKPSSEVAREPYDGPATISLNDHRPRPEIAQQMRSSAPRGDRQLPFRGDIS